MTDTGLPNLPNRDYFWRVRYHETHNPELWGSMWGTTVDKTKVQIQLIQRQVTETPRVRKRWLWKTTAMERDINDTVLFTENTEGTNPIAIHNSANRIMKKWDKAKERDALVGDYPPKKLEER